MHRLKRRKKVWRPTDEEIRRELAAHLVATRIVLGVTPAEMLDHIGYSYEKADRKERCGLTKEQWQVYRLALLESELADDGRLSTYQRYARALEIRRSVRVSLYSSREMHKLEARRRMYRIATRKRNKNTRRFPPL